MHTTVDVIDADGQQIFDARVEDDTPDGKQAVALRVNKSTGEIDIVDLVSFEGTTVKVTPGVLDALGTFLTEEQTHD